MDQSAPQGLEIVAGGHRARLKWHQLRRSARDGLFSTEVLAEGLRLGASMELDLRVRGDGGFVMLHDADLEGETTGRGPIASLRRDEIARETLLDGRALVFSEDLAGMLSRGHPDAVLQFDMQDDLAAIGERGLEHLATWFADVPCTVIINAYDIDLIVAARSRLPGLVRGIDPTPKLEAMEPDWRKIEGGLIVDAEGESAPDTIYLGWQFLLRAAAASVDLVGLCHARGIKVDAWTFNLAHPEGGFSDEEWRDFSGLLALKPDQITTDEAMATELAWRRRMRG